MRVVITDLDGTLLDSSTYSYAPALPALERLRELGIPVVIATSKARAEVESLRAAMGNTCPFIVENGGAVIVPRGYFGFTPPASYEQGACDVIRLGAPYEELLADLDAASRESGCRVRGFNDMSEEEVASLCDMPVASARLARQREFDEPFLVLDVAREAALLEAIASRGRRHTRGGRFHHIIGDSSKRRAAAIVRGLYERAYGEVISAGLGDAPNDAEFLNDVDVPILIRSHFSERLRKAVPRGRLTDEAGPAGWNSAILAWLDGAWLDEHK